MKKRFKLYFKLNLISIFFVVVSFISVTLAWFAYSGLAKVSTEIGVKAWYIELEKDGQTVSNDIVISLSEIYPGMNTVNETVNIKNQGDSDAQVKYSIISARILDKPEDNYVVNDIEVKSEYVEDVISHNYPFHVNINLEKNYVLAKGGEDTFKVSVSWPLDSDNDGFDSQWGTDAYKFQTSEEQKKSLDPNYQIKPAIQIVISVIAEQYLDTADSSDITYNLGDVILFDVVSNSVCSSISTTCLKTYVIDVNNKNGDGTVTLLPDPIYDYTSTTFNNYSEVFASTTAGWNVGTRYLEVSDILKVVSTDIINSVLVRENISDMIIGNLNYLGRINTELTRATSYNGYYKFINGNFSYLSSANCYWTNTEYNLNNGFAVKRYTETDSKIYNELKAMNCNVIPVILVNKSNL